MLLNYFQLLPAAPCCLAIGNVQILPRSGADCVLGDKNRASKALLRTAINGIPWINYHFGLGNGFTLGYLRFISEMLSIGAQIKLFSALSPNRWRFPGDLDASPTQHRVLLKLPTEQAAEFGADANSRALRGRAGDAPSLQEAAAPNINPVLSWLLTKLNTEPWKRIKFPLLTETWEQLQKPNLASAATSQSQRGFRLCLGVF